MVLATALFALCLALPTGAGLQQDPAEEAYRYLAGLYEKELYALVVSEADQFLEQHPRHAHAERVRFSRASALFELDQPARALPEFERLSKSPDFEFRAEAALRLGQCQLELGALDRARIALTDALAAGAEYLRAPATFLLGEVAFRSGDHVTAEKHYSAALELAPEGEHAALALRGQAWCELELGRNERAILRAQAFLAARPEHELASELRFVLGQAQLAAGRPREALATWRAIEEGAFLDAALRARGFAHSSQGELAAAAAIFGELLRRFPDGRFAAEAALQQGAHLVRSGEAEAALGVLRSAAAGETAHVLYWRARAEAESGAPELALATVDRALQGDPSAELGDSLRALRGDLAFQSGRLDEAARDYERAGSDYALHAAVIAHWNAGRPEEAARLAGEFARKYPRSEYRVATQLAAGEALYALGRYDEALALLAPIAAAGDEWPPAERARALSRVAWCRYSSGAPSEAAALFGGLAQRFGDAPEAEEALYMQGRAAAEAGDEAGARRAYAAYLERYEDGPSHGEVLLRASRLEPGTAQLEALLARAPDGPLADQARFELARKREAAGEFAGAAQDYRTLLERHPRSPHAHDARYGLAWCLRETGEHEAALRELDALLAARPADELKLVALELCVWSARDAGQIERCVSAWRAFGALCRDQARAFRATQVAAHALEAGGRPDEAQHLYESFLQAGGERSLALGARIERGWLALNAGAPERARSELDQAAQLAREGAATSPALAELEFFVGEVFFERAEYPRAAELFARAAATPGSGVVVEASYKQGFAELLAEQPIAAAQSFERVIAHGPESPLYGESLFLRGEALYRAGLHREATAPLEKLLSELPKHETRPKALFRLGLACAALEQWSRAQEVLSELTRRFPDFENRAEAELVRGRALVASGDARGARAAFARVIEADKGVLGARARIALGRLHFEAGAHDEALSQFLKVALLHAEEAEVTEALYRAGRCLEVQGEPGLARRQYEELIAQHADSSFAMDARERLRGL